jgi:GNAT superfamily N-acetyltransferase
MIIDNPITSQTLADFAQTLTSQDKVRLMDLVDSNLDLSQYPQEWQKIIRGESVQKHGTHDQSSHGNWADGVSSTVVEDIQRFTREWGGLSISMVDGSMPDKGFMVAKPPEFSHVVDEADFFDPIKGPKILADYMKKNRADLGRGGKDYLGTWLNGGKIYLDVSQNMMNREESIRVGRERNQKAIWDVVNQVEIDTGGTGEVQKGNQGGSTSRHLADDGRGNRPVRSGNLGEVGKAYKVIRFEPGLIPVLKHQEHDQSTHGSWANQGYSEDEQRRISEMSSVGPALADLDAILDSVSAGGSMAGMDDLRLIVENDQGMYLDATEDIDARVEERLARLQEEFPNHEYTEQEKATIYEDTQREMIDAYIEDNSDDLQAEYAAGRGDGDTESLLSDAQVFFEEVYNTQVEVKNPSGGESGYLESVVSGMEIADHPYDGSQNGIRVTGTILDSNGDYAGEFERTFFKENGEWQVEHNLFKVEDEYRGLGFGKDFLQRSEDWYTAVGVQNIELGTGWEGARHWARAGFDFNERYQQANMNSILSAMNTISEYRDDFKPGSPERIQFDALMSRATVDYVSDADGGQFTAIRSLDIPSNDVPIPNDFAMLGYADRTPFEYTAGNGEKRTGYTWAGERLLQDLNLKYKKSMTAEGRSLNQGPIDRDGDGMVYDGTPREKPASAVNS